MKCPRALLLVLAVAVALLPVAFFRMAEGQTMEAPTGFDNLTNGLVDQATHDADRAVFELARTVADGLGPPFNRTSCVDCHATPVTGGVSAVTELLAGSVVGGSFVARIVHENAICPAAQDPPPSPTEITTHRLTVNLLGDGYVESISDTTLSQIQASQPASLRGTLLMVPALEGGTGAGRFGWKNQHVSLLSFAADDFLSQIGITNALLPNELTTVCDTVADPEDVTNDTAALARFIRAAKAPPRYAKLAATPDARAGPKRSTSNG